MLQRLAQGTVAYKPDHRGAQHVCRDFTYEVAPQGAPCNTSTMPSTPLTVTIKCADIKEVQDVLAAAFDVVGQRVDVFTDWQLANSIEHLRHMLNVLSGVRE